MVARKGRKVFFCMFFISRTRDIILMSVGKRAAIGGDGALIE